jgi:O-antigen/teichoic acid export membrane protein
VTASQLALLRSQDRLLMFGVVSLLQSLVAELMSLTLVATTDGGATAFVVGRLLAQVAAVLVGVAALGAHGPRLVERRALVASLAFSLPLIPAALSSFVLGVSDRFVVQSMMGAEAVARYQVAYNIGSMPQLLVGVLAAAWLPRFFAASGDRRTLLVAARDQLDAVLAPVVLGLSVGAPLVLALWVPPSYDREGLLLLTALVVVSVYPVAASLSWTRVLLPAGRSRAVAYGNVGAATINVLLNLILVPVAGLEGAAVATVVSYLLLAAFLFAAGRRVESVPGRSARVLMLAWGAVVVALASAALPSDGAFLLIRVSIGIAAFLVMCRMLWKLQRR